MNNYRIKNITKKFDKRDKNYNQDVKISYSDGVMKHIINISPEDTVYVKFETLPPDVQKYRVMGLISVTQIVDSVFESKINIKKVKVEKSKIKKTEK